MTIDPTAELKRLRASIDNIDAAVVHMLAERFKATKAVGELKAQHAAGRTVVMTTHALYDVGEMCDRMAVIHQGELRFAGTPAEFLARYTAPDLERAYLACIADA